ncbi:3-hydroxyacyl-CoA dehydrogenase NAD-binding domain-containing protein [Streptomyces hesseae]|uniref:3-hydroxyacyl-CoA dehydrogenase NAD-binding domain-containing protein n=1 Tax=Streptomyces hesseae TaxID=3075519 RepID=A0ABU2STA5_9ACTN|nr:3-hydroxyacyl-CoA dehydrogenase NAD-binding domain-containing protein [Streptomyces sp. DSM 40473]MDT0452166.1 3-hydroxyacyl-CoA dehydrogenase NAD-binding domain-containing protein [Streptomyces sp. DSM 40473]
MTASTTGTAAVVGLGAAGAGLARRLAAAGIRTIGVEPDAEAAARARRTGVEVTADLSAVAAADVVLEAVPEPEPGKREVLAAIARHRRTGAPVVTTALTTPAAELADVAGGELLALRFARADRLDAAELARAPHTSDEAAASVAALLDRAGVTTHAVPDVPGSLAPRLLFGFLNQAAWMRHDGYADRDSLDTAVRLGCGWAEGPLEILDAVGHRTAGDILRGLHRRLGDRFAPAPPGTDPAGATARPPAGGAGGPADPTGTVAVIGSGTMATGIAEVFLRAGYRTVLVARTERKAADAREAVEFGLLRAGADEERLAEHLGRWTGTIDLTAVAGAGIVVEAVVEDLGVKRDLFARLGTLCAPGTLLATTTSSLSVRDCAAASGRPEDVLGLHFFNPAPAMELVELVRGEHTGEAAVARARAVLARLGKAGVECGDRTGFIVNALLFPYLNDALAALRHPSVTPALLDSVMKSVGGQPVGPTRLLDVVGADVALEVQHRLYEDSGRPELAPADLLRNLVDHGFLGRKTSGRGVRAFLAHEARTAAV